MIAMVRRGCGGNVTPYIEYLRWEEGGMCDRTADVAVTIPSNHVGPARQAATARVAPLERDDRHVVEMGVSSRSRNSSSS
jgi:hypothetical protein